MSERQELHRVEEDLEELFREVRHLRYRVRDLEHQLHHHHYRIRIEGDMAITAGSTGTFQAQMTDQNSVPVTGFTPSFSWTADDTNATLQPSADTTSCVVTVPATDTTTTLNLTATATAPDGTTVTGSLAVTVTPSSSATTYKIGITQVG